MHGNAGALKKLTPPSITTNMRDAFQLAVNTSERSAARGRVIRSLRRNRGVIHMKRWTFWRRKKR
jgi:hypothetical protein